MLKSLTSIFFPVMMACSTFPKGVVDSNAIERAILDRRSDFRMCYENSKKDVHAHGEMGGRIQVKFDIGESGNVSAASIEDTTIHHETLETCVLEVLKTIDFPKPVGGGPVTVLYPFYFQPMN